MKSAACVGILCIASLSSWGFEGTSSPNCLDGTTFSVTISDPKLTRKDQVLHFKNGCVEAEFFTKLGFKELKIGAGGASGDDKHISFAMSATCQSAAGDELVFAMDAIERKTNSGTDEVTLTGTIHLKYKNGQTEKWTVTGAGSKTKPSIPKD